MATTFDSTEVQWGDYAIAVNGKNIVKFRGLKYSVEQETEELYGAGNDPIDIQAGNRKYSGSLKVLKGAFEGINLAVQAVGYKDILDAPASAISIVAVYKPSGSRVLQTDTLLACKFEKYEKGMDQGDKMMEIELPFKFLSIKST